MATSSTADEPATITDDWQETPAASVDATPPEEIGEPRTTRAQIRAELWQPRYLVLACIILVLVVLQVWVLF